MPEPIPVVKVVNQPGFFEIAIAVAVGVAAGGLLLAVLLIPFQ